MKTVAKVFIIIGMVAGFWWVFPIIYGNKMIKKLDANIPLTTGEKVITLIFINTIAGILLLVDNEA